MSLETVRKIVVILLEDLIINFKWMIDAFIIEPNTNSK